MNKIFKYVCLALLVVGVVIAYFTDVAVAEYSALAVAFVSAGALCVGTYKKSEKKDWKVILAIVFTAVGALGLGIASVASSTVTSIITAIVGIIALIAGIIAGTKASK